jgi:hypothetical protein
VGSRDKYFTTSSFMTRIKVEIQRENISLLSIPSRWLPKNTSAENSEPCRESRLKKKIAYFQNFRILALNCILS